MEESIKPLNEEQIVEFKPIEVPKSSEPTPVNKETIKELPTWNIEPPIEVKRGN